MQKQTSEPEGLADFLQDASTLLNRLHECHSHLEMIGNDPDAARELSTALETLGARAQALGIAELADFSRKIQCLLKYGQSHNRLSDTPLRTLSACLTHLAWQLELIDPRTGQLGLDCEEQELLVEAFAGTLEMDTPGILSRVGNN